MVQWQTLNPYVLTDSLLVPLRYCCHVILNKVMDRGVYGTTTHALVQYINYHGYL